MKHIAAALGCRMTASACFMPCKRVPLVIDSATPPLAQYRGTCGLTQGLHSVVSTHLGS